MGKIKFSTTAKNRTNSVSYVILIVLGFTALSDSISVWSHRLENLHIKIHTKHINQILHICSILNQKTRQDAKIIALQVTVMLGIQQAGTVSDVSALEQK